MSGALYGQNSVEKCFIAFFFLGILNVYCILKTYDKDPYLIWLSPAFPNLV